MQFLNTSWLWSLAALSIPLVIHLWNIRQGKVLKVGSTSLLTAASKTSSRSLKLTDILLLIIRCLLLALIALLLAWPVWQKHMQAAKSKGWVLIPKENIREVYHQYQLQLDSLRKVGFELHDFHNGFAVIDSVQLKKLLQSGHGIQNQHPGNYWSLLNQLNSKVDNSTPVYLYTTQQLKHFNGEKPEVALNLHWQMFTPADSASYWIARAWLTNTQNIHVIVGSSHPAGTNYSTSITNGSPSVNSPFKVETDEGKLMVGLKEGNSPMVSVDTTTLRLAIYTDVNTTDASYLKAALQTFMQFTRQKAVVQQYTNPSAIPHGQDWLFWLSVRPLSRNLSQQTTHIFQYAAGKSANTNSWINTAPEHQLAGNATDLTLYKTILAPANTGQPVWTDGFGRPVLSLHQQGNQQVYRFYNRFNPAWNELVWSSRFPQVIAQLIEPAPTPDWVNDRREIAREQLLPLKGESAYTASPQFIKETDLRFALWLAAAILLLIERWLAHRIQTQTSHA